MARILVVDDEPMISMVMEDWLTELGYETVGPANSVRSALGFIESSPPDAAILDVALRNEDCYSIADTLRQRGIPFAFATGRGANGIDARFRDVPVLPKPFDFAAVRDAVTRLIGAAPSP